ncbi:MAG: hypothetical protein NVV59_19360 [Chitinophagaceae bacterium]|nr:hypothetical protein [Chitinophagaceae bacterium]
MKRNADGSKKIAQNPVHEMFLAVEKMEEMLQMMNPSIVFDMQKYHPASFRRFEEHVNGFMHGVVRGNMERGLEMDIYRSEIDVDILTRFRLASIFMMFNPEYFPLGKTDLGKALRETTMNFLYGITNAKGQKLINKYNQERLKKSNETLVTCSELNTYAVGTVTLPSKTKHNDPWNEAADGLHVTGTLAGTGKCPTNRSPRKARNEHSAGD